MLASGLTLAAFTGFETWQRGLAFGVGLAAIVLIHEWGHYAAIKRRQLPADMPLFLPGLGAYVRWNSLGVPAIVKAEISLAGPIAGMMAALGCLALWHTTGASQWGALANTGALLNVLNLMPAWFLDGREAVAVLGRRARLAIALIAISFWIAGRQSAFLPVMWAALYLWRWYHREAPTQPSRAIAVCFAALLVVLGVVLLLTRGLSLRLQ